MSRCWEKFSQAREVQLRAGFTSHWNQSDWSWYEEKGKSCSLPTPVHPSSLPWWGMGPLSWLIRQKTVLELWLRGCNTTWTRCSNPWSCRHPNTRSSIQRGPHGQGQWYHLLCSTSDPRERNTRSGFSSTCSLGQRFVTRCFHAAELLLSFFQAAELLLPALVSCYFSPSFKQCHSSSGSLRFTWQCPLGIKLHLRSSK